MTLDIGYRLAALLIPLASLVVSCHAVLTKRDSRSALTWVALAWFAPVVGVLLYLLFGINRLRRRVTLQSRETPHWEHGEAATCDLATLEQRLERRHRHLVTLASAVNRLTERPLLDGNTVEVLVDGDEAFPAMIEAIHQARISITLATYIFGNDRIGRAFADALTAAVRRGVAVRVLIDNAGERYTWPSMVGVLRRRGVVVARFFPSLPSRLFGINMRNHRKLLVIDGRIGFTGGMNIRRHHSREESGRRMARDFQFRLQGPVVQQLQEVFYEDWYFAARERLDGQLWFPPCRRRGEVVARGIRSGPDDNFLKHQDVLLAAIATAERSLRIVTPYFLPESTLISALTTAALRGIRIDIVLPESSNLPFVHWAMMAQLPQIMDHDIQVWLSPPPFDHAKAMIVDEVWSFIGSSNWDPRSLRLNFEFNVECYDPSLASVLTAHVDQRIRAARLLNLEELEDRAFPVRLRDGLTRLLMPYL
ncbi:cardiolipin synthase [Methylonatrum kenyense]|uniref:cardiolipin synthase n=1 Tax=Methylonatrum kenyense TaxID=455253 RepID=UPI0020BD494F|nr:cardiolipin synthase [Methylonatrum kenyense]MCK8516872.1 cardiolipin synthase [Methylonatrum kenyense]